MERDILSWFHHQYPDLQSAHSNFSSRGLNIGQHNSVPIYMSPYSNEVPVKGDYSPFLFSGPLESKAIQPTEAHNLFHCLPQFHQGFAPVLSTIVKEKIAPQSVDNAGLGSAQKRFLVFDQSGDQTTCTPVQCLPSWLPNPYTPCNVINKGPQIKGNGICSSGHYLSGEYSEENHRDDVESELHEDTEELNALLYSDDDDSYSEDGEVVSTGHSPSNMTVHDYSEEGEEVASSEWPSKRRKRLDGSIDMPSLVDTAASAKPFTCSDLEDDAESSCGNSDQVSESVSLSGKKRPRKDQILETISILQRLIPGGIGKDSMDVIDEAICYLRSLKMKAKSLGLDTV
ncbi:transcription factor bHLH143-like [Lycium barbarum]|uniref:transcription factor bHLH143-like n=1 Tax=Lycium barbarum TaxID=112863 RepID=UPI00293E0792|nr:transcription factor bHLH143-like [Lycium barbarum]